MVSNMQFAGMAVQIALSFLIPAGLLVYLMRKRQFSLKSFGVGVLIFILFSQVLEKLLHVAVIDPAGPALKWTDSKLAFVLYGALAAGIFEELGRYAGFALLLKRDREYKDGLSLGLGHGGIEAVLIGVAGGVTSMIIASQLNAGTLEQALGTMSAEMIETVKESIVQNGFWMYVLGGLERMFALTIHICFSLIVLLGVRLKQFRYVVYAILLHALFDVAPAMYQIGTIQNIWLVEGVFALYAILAFAFIVKVQKRF